MNRKRVIWFLIVMFGVQATFPYFLNEKAEAASSTHLGGKEISFKHIEDDSGGWAKYENGNVMQIDGFFIRADVNQLRAKWQQTLGKDVKLGGIGLNSPTAYTPPKGYKIHSYSSYAVYQMRTYLVQRDNSSCNGGLPVDNKCHPYYFDGVAGEDNRWAKRPNISSASDWVNYQPNLTRYNPGLKKDMLYYQWRTAQIRKQGDNNGHGGTPWLKYDFKIVPIAQTPVPEPKPDPEEPEPEEPEPEPDPIPNIPPRVTIDGPTIVMAGEEFCANAYGVDDDGYVDAYLWTPVQSEKAGDVLCTSYPNTGNQSITVVAIDNEGAVSIPATHIITVIAPQPSADFSVQGALKENRKVQLRTVHPYGERKGVIEAFPMVEEKWTITAMNAANQEYIKTHFNLAENISYDKVIDVLMKVKGDYRVKRHVKNSLGLEDTVEKIITIQPDYLPLADFDVVTKTFRDNILLKPGQSTATIKITDKSYSNDDYIKQRIWSYYYDSDNDGSYIDETEIIASKENETSMNINNLEKVGKYLIQLKVIEEFGQETIEDFVTSEDRRRHEVTIAQTELSIPIKPLSDRTVMIDNLAPNATYSVRLKGSTEDTEMDKTIVDVQIGLDKTTYSPAEVESAMTTVKTRLNAENIQSNITVKEIKKPYKITAFSTGLGYTGNLFVGLDNGDVYATGSNESNLFGQDDYINEINDRIYTSFIPITRTWGNDYITKISSEVGFANMLTNSGIVYTLGYSSIGGAENEGMYPNGIQYFNRSQYPKAQSINYWHANTFGDKKAKDIEAQHYSNLILLDTGEAYILGNESNLGRFSDGAVEDNTRRYRKMTGAWGTNKLKQVSTSPVHSLMLDETGTAYAAGTNTEGQMGTGGTQKAWNGVAVSKTWGNQRVAKVIAGNSSSYFLLENGDVYSTGNNFYGHLGIGNVGINMSGPTIKAPVLVHKSWGTEKIVDIAMSTNWTAAHFLTEGGDIYSTGRGAYGTFGNGSITNSNIPVKMNRVWGNQKIKSMHGGYYNVTLLTEKGELYIVGLNQHGSFGNGTTSSTPVTIPVRVSEPWNESRGGSPWSASDSDMAFGVLFGQEEFEEIDSITNEMLEHNLDFFGVGTAKNQTQMNEIITRNLNRGKSVNDVNNLETTANELADYIIEKINNKKTEKEIYLVLEESAEYLVNYRDEENDDKLSEVWKFDHTPQEFEHDMGIDFRHLKELASPIERFAKVGLYKPILRAKDNPIFWGDNRFDEYSKWSSDYDEWSIYVHRKPIPTFSFSIGIDRSYSITNQAYDLDKYSVNIGKGPGIRTQKWEWRLLNDESWQPGLPPNPLNNDIYEVKNTVVDFQNREESLIKKMDATGVNKPPVAQFEPIPSIIETLEDTQLINLSYDQNGDDLTSKWYWKVLGQNDTQYVEFAAGGTLINNVANTNWNPFKNFIAKGEYTFKLVVTDPYGLSDSTTRDVTVLADNEPPVACMRIPTPNYIGDTIFIENCASDEDNDPLTYIYTVIKENGGTLVINSGDSRIDADGNLTLKADQHPSDLGVWDIIQEVSDGTEKATTEGKLTVLDQIVEGSVQHTVKWIDNLTKYNADYPLKAINLYPANGLVEFLPGEKFVLQGSETEKASQISVYIKEYPIVYSSVQLVEDAASLNTWNGSMWHSDMIERFKDGDILTFVFTATFENGWVDTDEVQVRIKDDPFWRQHTTY